uniref:RRM domain-containing protein n=1 Tax=Salix viminalis TaxID=40686 RepID=A0A6N2LX05_SALVM
MSAKIEYRCFVGGLSWAPLTRSSTRLLASMDRETGRSRGFGFVTLGNEKEMRDAIEGMNGTDLDGRNITVTAAHSRGSGGGGERQMGHRDERNESERQRLNSGYKNPGGLVEFFARGGCSSNEVQVLKERIAWLEAANEDLCRELHDYRSRYTAVEQRETDAQDASICSVKTDGLKRSLHSVESPDYQMGETISGDSRDIDEEVAKEWEHTLLQNIMEENRSLKEGEEKERNSR